LIYSKSLRKTVVDQDRRAVSPVAQGSSFAHDWRRIVRLLACILAVATGALSACAAISGLDSYSDSPVEAVNAARTGQGTVTDGAGAPDEDGSASNEGSATAEGNEAGCGAGAACTGGATCVDGVCTSRSGAGADSAVDSGRDTAANVSPDAGCTHVDLPPSVNVDASQWTFATSPAWNCTTSATTTITASATGATISGDSCGGSATLGDITNGYAQTGGGPNVLVIRLRGLMVTGRHVIELAGTEPVIFLVDGDVTIDSGGQIDASANGNAAGPGGNSSACGTSAGTSSTATSTGGGGGGFGTAGGYGADQNGNRGSAGGAVAADVTLRPLRGGCSGGSGASGTNQGGAGGGAFEISAAGTLSIGATSTAYLSASGGYSAGASTSVTSNGSAGAGSGGGILLASPVAATFAHSSTVRVHGGGSGSGHGLSATSNAGSNGSATTDTPAPGGAAPDVGGAAGAAGGLCAGTGTTCAVSQAGSNGAQANVVADGSGGGGGGGAVQVISAAATASCN
jgi:hypothetical protein